MALRNLIRDRSDVVDLVYSLTERIVENIYKVIILEVEGDVVKNPVYEDKKVREAVNNAAAKELTVLKKLSKNILEKSSVDFNNGIGREKETYRVDFDRILVTSMYEESFVRDTNKRNVARINEQIFMVEDLVWVFTEVNIAIGTVLFEEVESKIESYEATTKKAIEIVKIHQNCLEPIYEVLLYLEIILVQVDQIIDFFVSGRALAVNTMEEVTYIFYIPKIKEMTGI